VLELKSAENSWAKILPKNPRQKNIKIKSVFPVLPITANLLKIIYYFVNKKYCGNQIPATIKIAGIIASLEINNDNRE